MRRHRRVGPARMSTPRASPVSRFRFTAEPGRRLMSGSLEPGQPARPRGHGPGAGEPVRPHRAAGARGAGEQVAVAADGRPLRGLVHPAHPRSSAPRPGSSRTTPRGCSPCWSWRPRVRSFSPRPWRSSAASTGRPGAGSSCATARRWKRLGSVTIAVFDKTGTLTIGHPSVSAVKRFGAFDEKPILRLAASVELGSGHPLARPVVTAAEERGSPARPGPTGVGSRPARA